VSDQQDKNIEQLAQETAAAGEDIQVDDAPQEAPHTVATPPGSSVSEPEPARRGSSSVVAWLALLLALVAAGGLGWLVREQLVRGDAGIAARLEAIEASAGRAAPDLDGLNRQWRAELDAVVQKMQVGTGDLDGQTSRLAQSIESVQSQLAGLEGKLAEQGTELARYSADERDDWLLAEAQYLTRLANQQLLMAGDAAAAQSLLESADGILAQLDSPRLHDVRAALASDLAAVRAVPRIDVEGIYLRLAALVEQADKLVIFQLPEREARTEPEPADTWQARLRQGYEAALAKLSDYIIIRRRDEPMQALMDPQWEGLVRQNLRMLLEQAQIALLSGNQLLYRDSLERAQHWVREFFESDEAAARAMSAEITTLAGTNIATDLPDITASVEALDDVMKQRLQQGGAE
jgi:uroporphyrin-3 C-methyltransferase